MSKISSQIRSYLFKGRQSPRARGELAHPSYAASQVSFKEASADTYTAYVGVFSQVQDTNLIYLSMKQHLGPKMKMRSISDVVFAALQVEAWAST